MLQETLITAVIIEWNTLLYVLGEIKVVLHYMQCSITSIVLGFFLSKI